jgi:hypothetical protein
LCHAPFSSFVANLPLDVFCIFLALPDGTLGLSTSARFGDEAVQERVARSSIYRRIVKPRS